MNRPKKKHGPRVKAEPKVERPYKINPDWLEQEKIQEAAYAMGYPRGFTYRFSEPLRFETTKVLDP